MKILLAVWGLLFLAGDLQASGRIVFYHGNIGMVTENIVINLEDESTRVIYDKLPNGIDDNSILLLSSYADQFTVDRQRYSTKIARWQVNIPNHIGEQIEIVLRDGDVITGEIFYGDNNVYGIHDTRGKSVIINRGDVSHYSLERLKKPEQTRSFIEWAIETNNPDQYPAELNYLTSGLSWETLYKAVWQEDGIMLDIFAKITNQSGKSYEKYDISLIAGEPSKIQQQRRMAVRGGVAAERRVRSEIAFDSAAGFEVAGFDEFYLFDFSDRVSISSGDNKQLRLYPRKTFRPQVFYDYITGEDNLTTRIEIDNKTEEGLGIVLPEGSIQIYRRTEQGEQLTFVGEDRINATPKKHKLRFSPGRPFDLTAKTVTLSQRRPSQRETVRQMQVEVKNHSKDNKDIRVYHSLAGEWTVSGNSHDYDKVDAATIVFSYQIAAEATLTISWKERVSR